MLKTIGKKAMIFTSPRDTISFIIGLILYIALYLVACVHNSCMVSAAELIPYFRKRIIGELAR